MPILNTATGEAHTFATLTDAINLRPRQPRDFSRLVPCAASGVRDDAIKVDRRAGIIDVVEPTVRDAQRERTEPGEYNTLTLAIQHYPGLVIVRESEVASRRAFGSETMYEMPVDRLNEKLDLQIAKYELTWEYQLISAAIGKVRNRAGNTVYDIAAQFGSGPTEIAIDFDASDLDVPGTVRQMKRQQEALAGDRVIDGWIWFVLGDTFEKIVSKESIKRAYDNWQGSSARQLDDERSGFKVANNVTIVEYNNATLPGGASIFPTGAGYEGGLFVPISQGLFQRRFSPMQAHGFTNEPGIPMYTSPEDLPHGKGTETEVESNFITYAQQPELIGRVKQA